MAKADYIAHLEAQMLEVDADLKRAEAALEADAAETTLRELSDLHGRRDAIAERIESAKSNGAEDWSDLHVSFQEEMDGLADTVRRFITRRD